ncbi:Cell division inhibitor [Leucobacter sp. 7(1)]|uniref:TIGR01777 family oxidoreductase n=1 Tax=Leucobacter sp. 7(1) TaxID=1255613 RepID=UPI00097F5AE2|nr:TIGR01777 family oxidoreductase [Leucobacter sp. 7(1)]SJN09988.1 Cell division inhibitor [Leucobacter sp. 7(1)]
MTHAARIIVSGSSGLIGSALVSSLRADGIPVTRLVRRAATRPDEIAWDPARPLHSEVLAGARAVVNLNGASIGKLPWTARYRSVLRDSRLAPTRALAAALRPLGEEAPAFLSASAVGIYGDRPGARLTEQDLPGSTFLAQLSAEWEAAALEAGPRARVALIRTASILHPRGVLKPLLPLTKLGLSGPLGRGDQVWPWISLDDEVGAIRHVIDHGLSGPINLAGPTPASARTIGSELARRLRRPYVLPAPAWALRLGLGRDAADSLLLADATVVPEALTQSGFAFRHRSAAEALDAALG